MLLPHGPVQFQSPSPGLYECTLNEAFRVQVQGGVILGFELPPTDVQDFEVHFTNTSGGPVKHVF